MRYTRRVRVSTVVLAGLAGAALACAAPRDASDRPKLVVLGFDGMDPDLVRQFVDAGQMPAFARLIAEGGMAPLATTVSPESPTAWASFATGVNPGKHNIYDFLVRDTETYMPDLGMVVREPPRFLFDWIPVARPKVTSTRGGTSFWVTAGEAGVRASVLTVPVTFPPEAVPNGELLSGLPLPDIRGTTGTFYFFATDLARYEEGNTEFGGILRRLAFDGDTARTALVGPPNPIVRARIREIREAGTLGDRDRTRLAELEARQDVTLPLVVRWRRGLGRAELEIGGRTIALAEGEWSDWVDLDFRVNVFVTLRGMTQFHLASAGEELRLYASPVNFRPEAPPVPISSPSGFAGDIAGRLGPFRTLGWAEATWPLNENRMDEDTFMDDLYRAFDDRAQVILDRLTKHEWDLLVGVIESPDRVQHMMWRLIDPAHPMYDEALAARHGDAILRVYRRADAFVAEVLEHLEPGTTLLIVSDHGFHSWRHAVNLNTWLVQEGYMTLHGQASGEKTLDDLFSGGGEFWEHVDWTRTRAYAMGLGQIYFNLRGREAQGIVSPGQEYLALTAELSDRLRTSLVDPDTGASIVSAVYARDDVYAGPYLGNAADLQVGFADGYRVSWQTALGGAPPGIVYPNLTKWSGDHGSFDHATTAGIVISNRPLSTDRPGIIDIAPTVLAFFGVPAPAGLDGRSIYR